MDAEEIVETSTDGDAAKPKRRVWGAYAALGGIILGRRGGSRYPGPVITRGGHTQSAGTEKIARQSGGDSFDVDQASAFENTLERLRHSLDEAAPPD